jgi:hypothetical protein
VIQEALGGLEMAKKRGAKKKGAKKTAKKKGVKKKAAKKKAKKIPGYSRQKGSGLFVPTDIADGETGIVRPSLMEKGIGEAKRRMKDMLHEMSDIDGVQIKSADFQVSLSAKGEFLGFGGGGATSITLHVDIDEE